MVTTEQSIEHRAPRDHPGGSLVCPDTPSPQSSLLGPLSPPHCEGKSGVCLATALTGCPLDCGCPPSPLLCLPLPWME